MSYSILPSFTQLMGPLASEAGSVLGVAPSTVLAQWALESGNGTAANALAANNFAGIMVPGSSNPQVLQSFPDAQSFEQAYVSLIENGYPLATNTGSDINAFVAGLTNNPSHLYTTTDPTTYANSLSGLAANTGISGSGATSGGTSGVASPTAATAASTSRSPLNLMILIVVILAAVGIIISMVWPGKKIVVEAVK